MEPGNPMSHQPNFPEHYPSCFRWEHALSHGIGSAWDPVPAPFPSLLLCGCEKAAPSLAVVSGLLCPAGKQEIFQGRNFYLVQTWGGISRKSRGSQLIACVVPVLFHSISGNGNSGVSVFMDSCSESSLQLLLKVTPE